MRDMVFKDCLPDARERLAEEGIENQLELVCCDDRVRGGRYGLDYSGRMHLHAEQGRQGNAAAGESESETGPSRIGEAR